MFNTGSASFCCRHSSPLMQLRVSCSRRGRTIPSARITSARMTLHISHHMNILALQHAAADAVGNQTRGVACVAAQLYDAHTALPASRGTSRHMSWQPAHPNMCMVLAKQGHQGMPAAVLLYLGCPDHTCARLQSLAQRATTVQPTPSFHWQIGRAAKGPGTGHRAKGPGSLSGKSCQHMLACLPALLQVQPARLGASPWPRTAWNVCSSLNAHHRGTPAPECHTSRATGQQPCWPSQPAPRPPHYCLHSCCCQPPAPVKQSALEPNVKGRAPINNCSLAA